MADPEAHFAAITTLANAMSEEADTDVFVYSGGIDRDGYGQISQAIRSSQRKTNAFLIISTYGGDPHAGFRIARMVQGHYQKFTICIPSYCKSAGTLVALGAHEIVISDDGELGPLDIQVRKKDEFDERGSGLDIMQALQVLQERSLDAFRKTLVDIKVGTRVSTKLAAETATLLTQGLFAPIYSQIDPVHLGELHRAMSIAFDYGRRLADTHRNLKTDALGKLVAGYCAHGFVIDRGEAEGLFNSVREPTEHEQNLLDMLEMLVKSPTDNAVVFKLNEDNHAVAEAGDHEQGEGNAVTGEEPREEAESGEEGGGDVPVIGEGAEERAPDGGEHGAGDDRPAAENVSQIRSNQ